MVGCFSGSSRDGIRRFSHPASTWPVARRDGLQQVAAWHGRALQEVLSSADELGAVFNGVAVAA